MVMHRCSGSEELYYWEINCFDGYKDCPNGEDESMTNPICFTPPTGKYQSFNHNLIRKSKVNKNRHF